MTERDITRFDLALLTVLMGVITTLVFYQYGTGNHITDLPIIKRIFDPEFLPLDFYTNVSAGNGPRLYFANLLVWLSTPETLPHVYFALTLLCNVAVALITGFFARSLFGGSNLAGASAACLVMSLSTFQLGFTRSIFMIQLVPSRMVVPLLLASVWAGLRQRPLLAAATAGAAAMIHPTFGIEVGVVTLGISLLVLLWRRGETRRIEIPAPAVRRTWWSRSLGMSPWGEFLFGTLLFWTCAAAAALPFLLTERTPSGEFVAIETLFRHPHHSLAGAQSTIDVLRGFVFFVGCALAWHIWRRRFNPDPHLARGVAVLVVGLIVGVTIGVLLFKLFPDRLLALARPLRLLYLVKWIGLVLGGGLLGTRLAALARGDTSSATVRTVALTAVFLALIAVPREGALWCLALYAALTAMLTALPRLRSLRLVTAAAAVFLVANVTWVDPTSADNASTAAALRPATTLDELGGPEIEVARWARTETAASSIFLTPPDFGIFRVIAERATVVDFKAFPFQDNAMVEWRDRLFACYGEPTLKGWQGLRQMRTTYRKLDVEDFIQTNRQYGATHAVLERETPTQRTVLYENESYKVVSLL